MNFLAYRVKFYIGRHLNSVLAIINSVFQHAFPCFEVSGTADIASESLRWPLWTSTVEGESRLASIVGVYDFFFWIFQVVFWGHQYQRFCRESISKIFLNGCKHTNLVRFWLKQIVFIITTTKFPVLSVNFWVDVPHKSGLHMTTGRSLHLQRHIFRRWDWLPSSLSIIRNVCLRFWFFFLLFFRRLACPLEP